jgi:hypothetical protein
LAAPRRHSGGHVGARFRGLAQSRPALSEHGENAAARRARAHRLGDARAAQVIRRFIDPRAVFLFVAPAEVEGVADRFNATPFDVEGVFWSHRGETCTFDVMVEEFGLATEPLLRLAAIVRGADTGRMDAAPQAAGLLAASLGLSRMYSEDLVPPSGSRDSGLREGTKVV